MIALERDDREMWRRLKDFGRADGAVTHAAVLGQVWRGQPRQARLSRALNTIAVVPVTEGLGRAGGELLSTTGLRDIVDATLVLLGDQGDELVTSDADDLAFLAEVAGIRLKIVPV